MTKNKIAAKGEIAALSDKRPAPPAADSVRETIESVVIAFLLAFLFRTFEAEAFVIPTGSMAPTLMGLHKDVRCAKCGYPYQANASSEENLETNQKTNNFVRDCTCPVCRYTMSVGKDNPQGKDYPSYSGDRLIVTKFPYQFSDPDRWDVVVFKYPFRASINYIKRLVGLPEETIRIQHGNLYVKSRTSDDFTIARKPPDKLRAMLQIVHDNDYVVHDPLVQAGWPARWQPEEGASSAAAWKSTAGGKTFETEGSTGELAFLRYHHTVPSPLQWDRFTRQGVSPQDLSARPQLITDFCFYNTSNQGGGGRGDLAKMLGRHWVGDLAVECELTAGTSQGGVVLELVEGGRRFQCRLDTASGQARLSIDGVESFQPTAQTKFRGGQVHQVLFANVDDQLTLWLDGKPVQFNSMTAFSDIDLGSEIPQEADLSPAGIAAEGVRLRVDHLRIWRDIYYIVPNGGDLLDYRWPDNSLGDLDNPQRLAELLSSPRDWRSLMEKRQTAEYQLGPDDFLMLGDNSPGSKDSRLWRSDDGRTPPHAVHRDLLIGKAMFIYWPHSWNRTGRDGVFFPFFPNFSRMGFVR